MTPALHRLTASALLMLSGATLAQAPVPADAPTLHPWQAPTPRANAEAYFTNLKDGDVIETPFVLKFGLSGGWGLAPITKAARAKSGHHHLLVNRDLPLNFKQPLPFNEQYIHFGKGQMEHVLTLAPGAYTLRMLLADKGHLPHFVFSKPVKITVRQKNATDPKSLQTPGIQLLLPSGTEARTPVLLQFHVSGLNVAHAEQQEKDTGHFRLTLKPASGGAPQVMDFTDGQTETWLAPPAGSYAVQLDFVDNLSPTRTLAPSANAQLRVR
ncbi:DUF4399 domain-containing protein [Hydrogenophaga sp. SL48]|uniref:DUF4399 domain-containing protein n=1 Tax=Hydrogenophaga sp. SL48 TaxID=2806347 RepID=UPI001F3816AA|nr:DUF4399 domain-containing protein [Hydrogenophaga sp. SL48]UJW79154.1 DUF4399 domain-containing protein [Hydrogenophaga sp. SL48]